MTPSLQCLGGPSEAHVVGFLRHVNNTGLEQRRRVATMGYTAFLSSMLEASGGKADDPSNAKC